MDIWTNIACSTCTVAYCLLLSRQDLLLQQKPYVINLESQLRTAVYRSAGVVDTLFISRQGHFSCPCRTGAVMLGSTGRALSPTASTSQLTRSLEARRSVALRLWIHHGSGSAKH